MNEPLKIIGNHTVIFKDKGLMVTKLTGPSVISIMKSLPYAQTLSNSDGSALVQLPWTEESCRVLNNIGLDMTTAAPFLEAPHPLIEGKYQPMQHQLMTAAFICLNPRCYVLSSPRTGKTGALTLAMDYLQRMRYVAGGFLVVTTVTTMPGVWRESIRQTVPDANVVIVNGKNRDAALAQVADFYVTNYDSIRLSCDTFIKAVKAGRIGACVIDELTHVGNVSSQRHKAIDRLVNGCNLQYVIGATGSPGNDPESTFGMCRMINRAKLPATTKRGWLNLTTFQYGPEPYMRKLAPGAPKIMHDAMQPAIRYNKKDIIDLPPVVTQDRECELSAEQRKMREEFKAEAVAVARSGETITAANGGVLFSKMLQVAQGFCMDNNGKPVPLEHKDRLRTIMDCIRETDRKVLIFGCFIHSNAALNADLISEGISSAVIDGKVPAQKRADILYDFQNKPDPKVLIAHPTCMAFGVEASAADTLIFNGPPPLGGFIFDQALERLSSAKQTAAKISIIRIAASPEEKRFFKSLDSGKEMGDFVSGLFEDYSKGLV